MKQNYMTPQTEIVEFSIEDVITTSLKSGGDAGDFGSDDDVLDGDIIFG